MTLRHSKNMTSTSCRRLVSHASSSLSARRPSWLPADPAVQLFIITHKPSAPFRCFQDYKHVYRESDHVVTSGTSAATHKLRLGYFTWEFLGLISRWNSPKCSNKITHDSGLVGRASAFQFKSLEFRRFGALLRLKSNQQH